MDRRIVLSIAFLLCAGGIYGLLTQQSDQPADEPLTELEQQQPDQRIQVWVAQRPFALGEKIHPADLKAQLLEPDKARAQGITTSELLQLGEGTLAGTYISTGAVILENQLLRPGQPAFTDFLLQPDKVPYPLVLAGNKGYNSILTPGDRVDVVLIATPGRNLADKQVGDAYQGLRVTPVLKSRHVVDIQKSENVTGESGNTTVIVALSHKDVSKMMIASRIGLIDVYKSTTSSLPSVEVSDVLSDFTSVTELRGREREVN